MPRYNPAVIEPKWQAYWEQNRTFAAPRLPTGPKFYVLDMFPYPSGDGLHVGHPEGYTATDIVCRYRRMRGQSVMHPMGWDAFGLPAEQHAKKTGTHPRITTEKNIANFRRQLKMLGFSYDWQRELATTDPQYFRWTQHIFLLLFDTWFDPRGQRGRPIAELPIPEEVAEEGPAAVERYRDGRRLAYQIEAPVNWCPALGTVLANEEVVGGVSERGGHPVVRLPLRQWMLRITAYADRLENDLEGWIGPRASSCSSGTGSAAAREPKWISSSARSSRPTAGPRGGSIGAGRWTARWPGSPTRPTSRYCGSTPRGRIRCSGPPTWWWPRSTRWWSGSPRPGRPRPSRHTASGPPERATWTAPIWPSRRPACSPGPMPSIRSTAEPIPVWVADYVLVKLRHGGDHGRAGPRHAGLRVRPEFDLPIVPVVAPQAVGGTGEPKGTVPFSADENAGQSPVGRGFCGRRPGDQQPRLRRPHDRGVQRADHGRSGRQGPGPPGGQLQAPRLAVQPAALLGRAVPHPARAGCRGPADRPHPPATARGPAPGPAPGDGLRRRPRPARAAAGQGPRRVAVRHARRQTLQARDEHHAPVGRLLLVLSPFSRSAERWGPGRSRSWNAPGCRSICTSAGRSTPCCTCSTPASGTKCCSTAATPAGPSPSANSSTKA